MQLVLIEAVSLEKHQRQQLNIAKISYLLNFYLVVAQSQIYKVSCETQTHK